MRVCFLLFYIFLIYSNPVSSSKFIYGMEDIPIFKKMEYVEDSFVLFDKIDGRYVSSEIKGNYAQNEVIKFYNQILPNLGWNKIEHLKFIRSEEILEIETVEGKNQISIIFSIYPGK